MSTEVDEIGDLDYLRIQDIVARVARVNLKDTVRVLRSLHIIYTFLGDTEKAYESAHKVMEDDMVSAMRYLGDGVVHPLGDKPEQGASEACDAFYALLRQIPSIADDIEELYEGLDSAWLNDRARLSKS